MEDLILIKKISFIVLWVVAIICFVSLIFTFFIEKELDQDLLLLMILSFGFVGIINIPKKVKGEE